MSEKKNTNVLTVHCITRQLLNYSINQNWAHLKLSRLIHTHSTIKLVPIATNSTNRKSAHERKALFLSAGQAQKRLQSLQYRTQNVSNIKARAVRVTSIAWCEGSDTEFHTDINETNSFRLIAFDKWSAILILREQHTFHFPRTTEFFVERFKCSLSCEMSWMISKSLGGIFQGSEEEKKSYQRMHRSACPFIGRERDGHIISPRVPLL